MWNDLLYIFEKITEWYSFISNDFLKTTINLSNFQIKSNFLLEIKKKIVI